MHNGEVPTNREANAHRRATPAQVRSTITHQKILDAAMELLSTKGLQGLNTNAVAKLAGVNVGTVYHYFGNKNAILREMYLNGFRQRDSYLGDKLMELPTTDDPAKWAEDLLNHLMKLRRKTPAIYVLRRALRAIPELADVEQHDSDRLALMLADLLTKRYGISARRARSASIVLVEATVSLLDRASAEPTDQRAVVREAITMVQTYLATLGINDVRPEPVS